ncbi:MAG TPA: 30S ribosomal protein S9 [Candidatus Paceibacterota bacterium]
MSKENRYIEAVGRRKTSVARVRITPATKTTLSINGKDFDKYFPTIELQKRALSPMKDATGDYLLTAKIMGGGISSQAEALRHGIARALIAEKPELRPTLKVKGYLKRDPRAKERRKFGLKKARKAPKWSKR